VYVIVCGEIVVATSFAVTVFGMSVAQENGDIDGFRQGVTVLGAVHPPQASIGKEHPASIETVPDIVVRCPIVVSVDVEAVIVPHVPELGAHLALAEGINALSGKRVRSISIILNLANFIIII
jgi:hypothetical protein